jgi:hypothetical protein
MDSHLFTPLICILAESFTPSWNVLDTVSGYIQGLLDGIEFKQTAYALDRDSRKAALARLLKIASGSDQEGSRRSAA